MEHRIANITLEDCLKKLKELVLMPYVFTQDIPEILNDDFRTFITGHTLSTVEGKEVTYDFKAYYDKIIYKNGVDYRIAWAK